MNKITDLLNTFSISSWDDYEILRKKKDKTVSKNYLNKKNKDILGILYDLIRIFIIRHDEITNKHVEKLILSGCDLSVDNLIYLFKNFPFFSPYMTNFNELDLSENKNTNNSKVLQSMYDNLRKNKQKKKLTIKLCNCGLKLSQDIDIERQKGMKKKTLYKVIKILQEKNIQIWLNHTIEEIKIIENNLKQLKKSK